MPLITSPAASPQLDQIDTPPTVNEVTADDAVLPDLVDDFLGAFFEEHWLEMDAGDPQFLSHLELNLFALLEDPSVALSEVLVP